MTGFSAKVRLQTRTRAGNGDPFQALCECCGTWLGLHGGQIQHRLARGMGGSRNPLVKSVVNAALLCGTTFTLCHGNAESRNREHGMEAKGFVIRSGNGPEHDPRFVPVTLFTGRKVRFGDDGQYHDEPPGEVAA
jgi:hypothetical protein